jgi:hypothetical protein
MVGRWRWRCPLAAAVRTGSRPIGLAVPWTWGVRPTGRSRGPPCPAPDQPLSGVRRRDWSAETVSRRVSGGRTLADAGVQPDCGHVRNAMARSSRCLPGRPRVWCGPTSGSGAEACYAIDRADGRGCRRVGEWVSASNFRLSALAGRPGLCSAAGCARRGDRLVAGESLGGRASIKDSKDISL